MTVVATADQVLKLLVTRYVPLDTSVSLIPGVLAVTHLRNAGTAFNLRTDLSPLIPAAVALTVIFLLFYRKARWATTALSRTALALAGGGAVGNLVDRVRVGGVIDYIDLQVWPVFNFADAAVTVGAGLLILALIRGD